VTTANDEEPVEALGADGPDPTLGVGVGVRGLDRRDEHLGILGAEHVVEPATELRVAVSEHKAEPQSSIRCRQEKVAGLLGDPGTIGVGRHAGQVDPAGGQLDEEQHIQPPQADGVDREEVAGEDAGRLLAQERPLGRGRRSWRRVQSMTAQRGADRGCRDPDAEPEQLALDALVAPAWVLPGQADDQPLQFLVQWRSPGSAVRVGPGAGDQPPVPAQQRLRPDEEARPAGPGQGAADRGEHRAVGRSEPRSWGLAAQHGQLVTEHQDPRSLAALPRASSTSSWMERHRVR
jgi:hypothetical protein